MLTRILLTQMFQPPREKSTFCLQYPSSVPERPLFETRQPGVRVSKRRPHRSWAWPLRRWGQRRSMGPSRGGSGRRGRWKGRNGRRRREGQEPNASATFHEEKASSRSREVLCEASYQASPLFLSTFFRWGSRDWGWVSHQQLQIPPRFRLSTVSFPLNRPWGRYKRR